jgi:hypothetical protein
MQAPLEMRLRAKVPFADEKCIVLSTAPAIHATRPSKTAKVIPDFIRKTFNSVQNSTSEVVRRLVLDRGIFIHKDGINIGVDSRQGRICASHPPRKIGVFGGGGFVVADEHDQSFGFGLPFEFVHGFPDRAVDVFCGSQQLNSS